MQMKKLHNWDLSYSQAAELQKTLACSVQLQKVIKQPKLAAGMDCALSKNGRQIFAAVVVLKLPELKIVETTSSACELTFPYIPGLLSFREAPAYIAAVEKLRSTPDVFIIDGQGIAHPRRLGLAAHLGLFFDKPTIGCAKSRLCGSFKEPPLQKGSYCWMMDDVRGMRDEIIGAVLRTRANVKPVFVSVGNKCTLADAIEIILACTTRYRLPEPNRLAHQLAGKIKTQ
jgi:deoxyribonuclease V